MDIFLKNWVAFISRTHGTGALLDNRTNEEKESDILFEEIVATTQDVKWMEKPEASWRKFKEQNQSTSSSCVAQSTRKYLGIMFQVNEGGEYIDFSATDIYQRRTNKPQEGMIGVDALKIAGDGVTLNALVQSDNMTEAQMNSYKIAEYKKQVGKIFKAGEPITLPIRDIDTVASVIQKTGKGVVLFFYFTREEWSKKVPTINDKLLSIRGYITLRHAVTAVDFTLYGGKKALIIEDSSHFGGISRRVITEDFFKVRNYFAGYTMNFKFGEFTEIPQHLKYTFTKDLEYKSHYQVEEDVKKMQNILKHEGVFPLNIASSGWYGPVTVKAVKDLQSKYGMLASGTFNGVTRDFINNKYKA